MSSLFSSYEGLTGKNSPLEKFTKEGIVFNAVRNTETVDTSPSRGRPQKKLSWTFQGSNFPSVHKGIPFRTTYLLHGDQTLRLLFRGLGKGISSVRRN